MDKTPNRQLRRRQISGALKAAEDVNKQLLEQLLEMSKERTILLGIIANELRLSDVDVFQSWNGNLPRTTWRRSISFFPPSGDGASFNLPEDQKDLIPEWVPEKVAPMPVTFHAAIPRLLRMADFVRQRRGH